MITCTNCQHEELIGTIFCNECGNQLVHSSRVTQGISTGGMNGMTDITAPIRNSVPVSLSAWTTLHLLESGEFLPLTDRQEYTMGRTSEDQPIMPDIDLSQYNAYESGVSRLHAVIKKSDNRIIIMDLGSSNGTYLNGNRLEPNISRALSHGDILSLGKLKIQVLLV